MSESGTLGGKSKKRITSQHILVILNFTNQFYVGSPTFLIEIELLRLRSFWSQVLGHRMVGRVEGPEEGLKHLN